MRSIGAICYLEDLDEITSETDGEADGRVRYHSQHKVIGRARIKRILNPSAGFELDEYGDPRQYMRAEVELLDEVPDTKLSMEAVQELAPLWERLRNASKELDEPQLPGQSILTLFTRWQLADVWKSHMMTVQVRRANARAKRKIQDWIRFEQNSGRLPSDLPPLPKGHSFAKLGVPLTLLNELKWSWSSRWLQLDDDFFEPLLQLQAVPDEKTWQSLFLENMRNQFKLSYTRLSLKKMLDGGQVDGGWLNGTLPAGQLCGKNILDEDSAARDW